MLSLTLGQPTLITLKNCGAPAPGKFCPACGQETAAGPRKLADFLGGWISRYLTRQGQLWQTLSKLFFAPGALTVEFVARRRARYLRPFQLYLMISVVVFVDVALTDETNVFAAASASGIRVTV